MLRSKYNFKGIKKLGAAGLRGAQATSGLAWMLKFGALNDLLLEFAVNWLANRSLILLNLGANFVEGELDQKAFDDAMDAAYNEILTKTGRDALTPAQKKAIDDAVIKAGRKFIVLTRSK